MGLQRFPYKRYGGFFSGDDPFEIPSEGSFDEYNLVPISYKTLEGVRSRPGIKQSFRRQIDGSPGVGINFGANLRAAILWNKPNKIVFSDNTALIKQVDAGGPTISTIYATASGQSWSFLVATNNTNVETLWAMPTVAGTGVPQKWDGVAATTSAWAGGVPTSGFLTYYRGRVIVWGVPNFPQRVFYSDPLNPEGPATANYGNNFQDFPVNISYASGIAACVPHQESLIIFGRDSVWQVYDPGTFANRRLVSGEGLGGGVLSHPNGRIYFMSNNSRFLSLSMRGDLQEEGYNVRNALRATMTSGTSGAGALYKSPLDDSIFVKGPSTDMFEFIPGEPGKGTWFRHRHPESYSLIFYGSFINSPALMAVGNAGGWLLELRAFNNPDPGINDERAVGAAVAIAPRPYWRSSWRPFISQEPIERVRRVHIMGGGTMDLDMYAEAAPRANPVAKFSAAGINLGTLGVIGTSGDDRGFSTQRPETRGRYHAFKLTASSGAAFAADELEFAFRGGKEHVQ